MVAGAACLAQAVDRAQAANPRAGNYRYPPPPAQKHVARNRAELVELLARVSRGDHIILPRDGVYVGAPIEIHRSDVVIRGSYLGRAVIHLPFRLRPGTRNVWLWGLEVVDVINPFTVAGDDHVIGRCRIIRPGGVTISVGRCNNLWVFACEFLGQKSWTAKEHARSAAGETPVRMHIRYERDYPRGLRVTRCLFRGGLRRPIVTSYASAQPDFVEPGGSGNLGNTASFAKFEYLLLDNHPGYDDLLESGAIFDIKTSRVTARHITLKRTRGRIDIRIGHGSRLEGIWVGDRSDGTNIHGGGHIVNGWRGGRDSVLRLVSGDVEWNVSNSNHPYAYRCNLHHVDGPILLGYRNLRYPVKQTTIYAHRSGGITRLREAGTSILATSPLARVTPVELTDADVGCDWGM